MHVPVTFAITAHSLLEEGLSVDAVGVCAAGVAAYPDYLTGYLVLAKAYAACGMSDDALIIAAEAGRLFPASPGVGRLRLYLGSLRPMSNQRQNLQRESWEAVTVKSLDEQKQDPSLVDNQTPTSAAIHDDISAADSLRSQDMQPRDLPPSTFVPTVETSLRTPAPLPTTSEPNARASEPPFAPTLQPPTPGPAPTESPTARVATKVPTEQPTAHVAPTKVPTEQPTAPFYKVPTEQPRVAIDSTKASNAHSKAPEEPIIKDIPTSERSMLRIIETSSQANESRIIRSASVRLIPGLEFASLRFEDMRTRGRRNIQILPPDPIFRTLGNALPLPPPEQTAPQDRRRLSLEDLARRLEEARIPRTSDQLTMPSANANVTTDQPRPAVTETIAGIYARQGALEKAIEAYEQLQILRPAEAERYAHIISKLRIRLES